MEYAETFGANRLGSAFRMRLYAYGVPDGKR